MSLSVGPQGQDPDVVSVVLLEGANGEEDGAMRLVREGTTWKVLSWTLGAEARQLRAARTCQQTFGH